MDPAKLPAIRGEIWQLMHAAQLHRDLGLDERPEDDEFDDFLLHVDGWLCEIKDVQIRDGLHVLGQAPDRRGPGQPGARRSCAPRRCGAGRARRTRTARRARPERRRRDHRPSTRSRPQARALVLAMEDGGWDPAAVDGLHDDPTVRQVLRFAADGGGAPACAAPPTSWTRLLHALEGGYVPAGPVGLAPARPGQRAADRTQLLHRRPACGAVPAGLADRAGDGRLAGAALPRRDRRATRPRSASRCGAPPRCAPPATTSPRCWPCSASARSGTRCRAGSRDLEVVDLEELGRPRIDVTVRICGFFRDAFPHVVAMLDDAVQLVAGLDEPDDANYVRAHARADLAEHGDERRATTRIFGSKPGSYGAGILQVIESGTWRDDAGPRRGLHGVGRLRLRPRPRRRAGRRRHADGVPADQGGGEERRQPASTTSPTPTTTSSTTAAWSPPCAR